MKYVYPTTAQQLIEVLKGTDDEDCRLFLDSTFPSKWTADDIEEMVRAAATDETSIKSLWIRPNILSHLSVSPFLEFLRHTTTLHELILLDSRGWDSRGNPRNRRKQTRMIVEMIYLAALRNQCLPVKSFHTETIGNPHLFQQLLSSFKIESLCLSKLGSPETSISAESGRALAVSLHNSKSIKNIKFNFDCDSQTMRRIVLSLYNHPSLEKAALAGECDAGSFDLLFTTLCGGSCPKIKEVDLDPTGLESFNIAPLLSMFRFGRLLETLELAGLSVMDEGPETISLPANKTLQNLVFSNVKFEENSLKTLLHFSALKYLRFVGCRGVSGAISGTLDSLVTLETLYFDLDGEDEKNHFFANISRIFAQGPPDIQFCVNRPIILQTLSDIALGLRSRKRPMRAFGFTGTLYNSDWEQGALDLFRNDILPLLREVEELSIDYSTSDIPSQHAEVCRFFGGLDTLAKLKHLTFGYGFPTRKTTDAYLKYLKKNEVIISINGTDFGEGLDWANCTEDHYIKLNRYGRQHLRNQDIPVGVWPSVLAGIAKDGEDGAMFGFLKTLNHMVDLFKNA